MTAITETLVQALAHHRAGRWEQAEQAYRQVLQVDPECADAWHLLGAMNCQTGNQLAAADYIGRAIELSPRSASFHNSLGVTCRALKKLDEAVACYRSALDLKPDYAEAYNNLGVALRERGELGEAAACCRRALELKADYPEAHNNLGIALMDQGAADEAVACYRRAMELKPDYSEAHMNLGIVLTAQGRADEAVPCGKRAVELKPDYAEAHKTLADALCMQRKPDEAAASYGRALELKPDYFEARNNLGNALMELGKVDQAIGCYRRVLEIRPDYPEAHNNLGNALLEQGKAEEAVACFRRALELNPDYPEAHNNLGNALKDRGLADEAERCWRRALELNPESVPAHNSLGIALKQQGKLEDAIDAYRRALELKPDYAEAYNNLANALWEQGKTPEAEACWRRAIELKPCCADGYTNLGMMLYEKRRYAEAATVLRGWLQHDPQNAVALHMVAAFTGQDTPARAADEYIRANFDHFARSFDKRLQQLDYHAPDLVLAAVTEALGEPKGELAVLDAGCGTGWCGPMLRPYARRLIGVDLSPTMIEQARARQVYDELIVAELTAHLESAAECCDLVASADTLVYFGDLKPVCAAAAGALRSGGRLIFTLEKAGQAEAENQGFFLQHNGRYCHVEDYVRRTLIDAGFSVHTLTRGILRKEMGQPVEGIVVSAVKNHVLRCTTKESTQLFRS